MPENASAAVNVPTDKRIAELALRFDRLDNEAVFQLFEDVLTIIESIQIAGSLSHTDFIDKIDSDVEKKQKEELFPLVLQTVDLIEHHHTSYSLGPAFD